MFKQFGSFARSFLLATSTATRVFAGASTLRAACGWSNSCVDGDDSGCADEPCYCDDNAPRTYTSCWDCGPLIPGGPPNTYMKVITYYEVDSFFVCNVECSQDIIEPCFLDG